MNIDVKLIGTCLVFLILISGMGFALFSDIGDFRNNVVPLVYDLGEDCWTEPKNETHYCNERFMYGWRVERVEVTTTTRGVIGGRQLTGRFSIPTGDRSIADCLTYEREKRVCQ